MKLTVKNIEEQLEREAPELLKDLGLLPEGYRCRARLHGKSRDKRRTASFDKSWSPDTDSIIIEFERNSKPQRQGSLSLESTQQFPRTEPASSPSSQQGRSDLLQQFAGLSVEPASPQPPLQGPQPPALPSGSAQLDPAPKSDAAAADAVYDLVRALDRAESRRGYTFVALKWFRDAALISEGFAWASVDSERQAVLRRAIDNRLVLTSKVPNPKSPQFPVTAIRLNRLMPEVKAILATPDDGLPDFQPVSIRGESLSSTVLRDRR
jgi:hypothetical protein